MGINLRSESEDSGVELASSDLSLPFPCGSGSTGNVESDPVPTEREEDGLTHASSSQSPIRLVTSSTTSSPLSLRPIRPETPLDHPVALHLKVEQVLQRTNPRCPVQRTIPTSCADELVLSQQPLTSSLPRRHTTSLIKCQRSRPLGTRRTVSTSMSSQQMPEACRRPLTLYHDTLLAEKKGVHQGGEDAVRSGPGLSYLEQVCRMLEQIARLQIHNRGLQMELDVLREHHTKADEVAESAQCDCKADAGDSTSGQGREIAELKHISSEIQQTDFVAHNFRRRSSSDTKLLAGHLGKDKMDSRRHHTNQDDLLEEAAEHNEKHHEKQKLKIQYKSKSWKLKVGSLRREDSTHHSDSEMNRGSSEAQYWIM
ncbi:uncharacterized protein si:dkey-106l3.7 isoform X2 [Lampris incognitus]|uniref:uncharacterized protein si:dkey-106l3.7 isoform X2 n=1 Tax=Lampris incognitus TaxID=2546036 RepID=UPI0024B62922|nr:uncharacterized protein si:dkey-106l3.7 isoform X2 [Lampris incognitus]